MYRYGDRLLRLATELDDHLRLNNAEHPFPRRVTAPLDTKSDRFRLRPDEVHHRIEFRRCLDAIEAGDEAERQDIHQRVTIKPARLHLAAQLRAARRESLIEILLQRRTWQQEPAAQIASFIER